MATSFRKQQTMEQDHIGYLGMYILHNKVMTIVILFLLSIVVLEIGQSNWDIINLQCFAEGYTSFYF